MTSSVAPAAVGIYSRPQAWRQNGLVALEEFKMNPAVAWGLEHEKDALWEYECLTGNIPTETLDNQRFYVHQEYPWLGATPDGKIGSDGSLELKCPMSLPDEPTAAWLVQTNVQMEVCRRVFCDIVAWSEQETRVWRVCRSFEFFRQIRPYLMAFYRSIRDLQAPPRFKRKPKLDYSVIAWERVH